MSFTKMPWSFYATIVSFGIFFASLNIYILTLWLLHPMASPLWLIGVAIGGLCLIYSLYMVRIHQIELVEKKRQEESDGVIQN
jgi:hypothetical protein